MNDDTIGTVLLAVIIAMVGGFFGYAIYTDEYEVAREKKCIEYSKNTGTCAQYEEYWVCRVESPDGSVVRVCGDDVEKCNEVCLEYNLKVK